jgi:outer membrane immunogenic protein
MRRTLLLIGGVAGLTAFSADVLAAELELPRKKQPEAQRQQPSRQQSTEVSSRATNWTGGQAGAQGGLSSMAQNFAEPGANLFFVPSFNGVSRTSPVSDPETPFAFKGHPTSLTGGGFLGYTFQAGNFVYGVEGDLNYKHASTSSELTTATTATYVPPVPPIVVTAAAALPTTTATRTELFTGQVQQTWDSSVRARFGVLVTDSTLLYGTGGVAFGNVTSAFSYSASASYCSTVIGAAACATSALYTTSGAASFRETRVGWTAGLGVETAVALGWKARLEYRYTDLGSFSEDVPLTRTCTSGGNACATSGSTVALINLRESFQAVRLGFAYGF